MNLTLNEIGAGMFLRDSADNVLVAEILDEQTGWKIVRAVNCHDELVAALGRARKMLGPHSLHPDAMGFAMIDAALARAKGEE